MVPYVILGLIVISFILNFIVETTFKRTRKKTMLSSVSGEVAARRVLSINQIHSVKIKASEEYNYNLYHPITKEIHLGPEVFGKKTVYSLAIGTHEACHASKYNDWRFLDFYIIKLKKFIFLPAFIASFFFHYSILQSFVLWAYVVFAALYLFINVSDEILTNKRAKKVLKQMQEVSNKEREQAHKIYRVMNLSYVTSIPIQAFINIH
ncbi:zinc metallopeptidase [Priestia filamentosa]|uniref:zinc metallopeptidase n=1 Tax=Priestia filamentosa TaxID=1402861 RepID=UPI00397C49EB